MRSYHPDQRANDLEVEQRSSGLIEVRAAGVVRVGGGIISGNASEGIAEVRGSDTNPRDDDDHGLRLFSGGQSVVAALAGNARDGVRELGGERGIRAEEGGQKGEAEAVIASGADLLLAFGVRFDDRVTGKVQKFCETGTIVHIDVDPSEINKNKPANLPIVSDIKYALTRLNELVRQRPAAKKFTAWHKQIAEWKTKAPLGYRVTEEVAQSQRAT